MTEKALQEAIVDLLRHLGCVVLVTSARSYRAPTGERRGYGADRGVPDLLVAPPFTPPGVWLGLEVKTRAGRLSPDQKRLAEAARITVVRSLADAVDAVLAFFAGIPKAAWVTKEALAHERERFQRVLSQLRTGAA